MWFYEEGSGGEQRVSIAELSSLGNEGRSGKGARLLGDCAPLAHLGPLLQLTKRPSAWLAGRAGADLEACLPVTVRLSAALTLHFPASAAVADSGV